MSTQGGTVTPHVQREAANCHQGSSRGWKPFAGTWSMQRWFRTVVACLRGTIYNTVTHCTALQATDDLLSDVNTSVL